MPLWLQGVFESAQAAILSALLVALPLVVVWATGGFANSQPDALARLAGQAWLLIHGVPLELSNQGNGTAAGGTTAGMLTLTPLALTLIPFLLAWRAGRRLARASYTDQLWQALLGSWAVYSAFGAATAFVCRSSDVVSQSLVCHAHSRSSRRAGHGGGSPPRSGLLAEIDRRGCCGLDIADQPTLQMGRFLPGLRWQSRVCGAHGGAWTVLRAARC